MSSKYVLGNEFINNTFFFTLPILNMSHDVFCAVLFPHHGCILNWDISQPPLNRTRPFCPKISGYAGEPV